MPYVAPSTVVAGQTYSASAHNVIVNDVIDLDSRLRVVTSSTRPGSPTEGMFIYETDTQKTLIYNGSSWVEVSDLDNTGGISDGLYGSIRRLAFQTVTTNTTISATSVATAPDFFASDLTWTADGTSSYVIEFFSRGVETAISAGAVLNGYIVDGSGTSLGEIIYLGFGDGTRSAAAPLYLKTRYTPAAGSRSINLRFTRGVGNGLVYANASDPGIAWMAVYGPDIT